MQLGQKHTMQLSNPFLRLENQPITFTSSIFTEIGKSRILYGNLVQFQVCQHPNPKTTACISTSYFELIFFSSDKWTAEVPFWLTFPLMMDAFKKSLYLRFSEVCYILTKLLE
jgi:hypothetical protein